MVHQCIYAPLNFNWDWMIDIWDVQLCQHLFVKGLVGHSFISTNAAKCPFETNFSVIYIKIRELELRIKYVKIRFNRYFFHNRQAVRHFPWFIDYQFVNYKCLNVRGWAASVINRCHGDSYCLDSILHSLTIYFICSRFYNFLFWRNGNILVRRVLVIRI